MVAVWSNRPCYFHCGFASPESEPKTSVNDGLQLSGWPAVARFINIDHLLATLAPRHGGSGGGRNLICPVIKVLRLLKAQNGSEPTIGTVAGMQAMTPYSLGWVLISMHTRFVPNNHQFYSPRSSDERLKKLARCILAQLIHLTCRFSGWFVVYGRND